MLKNPLAPYVTLDQKDPKILEQVFDYPINDPLSVSKVKFKHLVLILKTESY